MSFKLREWRDGGPGFIDMALVGLDLSSHRFTSPPFALSAEPFMRYRLRVSHLTDYADRVHVERHDCVIHIDNIISQKIYQPSLELTTRFRGLPLLASWLWPIRSRGMGCNPTLTSPRLVEHRLYCIDFSFLTDLNFQLALPKFQR